MGMPRSRPAARLTRCLAVAGLCSVGAPTPAFAGSGARTASAAAPTTLYYETQTGPTTFAIDARGLAEHRPSSQVVALRNYNVYGIAVGGRSIYWSTQSGPRDRGSIMQAPLDGGRAHRLVGGLTEPASVAVVGRHVYWDDRSAIGRVALNGSHPHPRLIRLPAEAGGGVADGLTSDGRHLYFSRCADNTIGRADLDGSHVHQRFMSIAGRRCPQGLAAAGGHIFWTELGQGMIGRASLDGHGVNPHWLQVHTHQGPFQVAVGGDRVYWTWGGENGSPSYTGRADENRSHLDRRFLLDSMYPMALAS
jgi:hypothetical protein